MLAMVQVGPVAQGAVQEMNESPCFDARRCHTCHTSCTAEACCKCVQGLYATQCNSDCQQHRHRLSMHACWPACLNLHQHEQPCHHGLSPQKLIQFKPTGNSRACTSQHLHAHQQHSLSQQCPGICSNSPLESGTALQRSQRGQCTETICTPGTYTLLHRHSINKPQGVPSTRQTAFEH